VAATSRSPADEGSYASHTEDIDVPDATGVVVDAGFGRADLTAFCRLDELGLEVTSQRLEPGRAVLACRVVEPAGSDERWCRVRGAW
jgi:hypothetical protein